MISQHLNHLGRSLEAALQGHKSSNGLPLDLVTFPYYGRLGN